MSKSTQNKKLVLVAMIFAVSMMFIDQTIVALAIPSLSKHLSLSSTGAQWIVNGYLLSLSALFAFGGRLADVLGHRRMVMIGVAAFAICSALCGATPTGALAEPWMITFRVLQGASAAILFPAALAIVVASFPVSERGRALALFFGIAGGLTAVGPLLGGYLTEWTWRSIFWINIPVALVALVLTYKAKPAQERHHARIDFRGALLISGGVGLVVLGLQQAGAWGWTDVRTLGCVAAGLLVAATFVVSQLRAQDPLIDLRVFAVRAFAFDNAVLVLISMVFIPFVFFASLYAQASLGDNATNAGTLLLAFFGGFIVASQRGGKILDTRGARPAVLLGCALCAAGFFLWGTQLPNLDFSGQWYYLVLAGAGLGLVLGPVSADAFNRAPGSGYGEVTGITQTVRNLGASLGLAVMGSIFITENATRVTSTLTANGVPSAQAHTIAHSISAGNANAHPGSTPGAVMHAVQLDFAHSTQTIAWVMAGIMLVAFVVAKVGLPAGRAQEPSRAEAAATTA
jgi:EmrB/QacA subfamily drug resistance transporter